MTGPEREAAEAEAAQAVAEERAAAVLHLRRLAEDVAEFPGARAVVHEAAMGLRAGVHRHGFKVQ